MPKRHRNKIRGGGFFDGLQNAVSGVTNNVSSLGSSFTGLFGSKKTTQNAITPTAPITPTTTTTITPTTTTMNTGGRNRRSKKHMRGGYTYNTPTTGLAAHAAPFSGPTAQPHNWVGGKTRRRKHKKNGKTRRHRRR
jgi:hypothetical protein